MTGRPPPFAICDVGEKFRLLAAGRGTDGRIARGCKRHFRITGGGGIGGKRRGGEWSDALREGAAQARITEDQIAGKIVPGDGEVDQGIIVLPVARIGR